MGNCCRNKVLPQNEEVPVRKAHHRMTLLVKVQSRKRRFLSAIRRKLRRRRSSSSEEGEEETAAQGEQNQSKAPEGAQDRLAVEENVNKEEEFEGSMLTLWKEYRSYFPDGTPEEESCDVEPKKWGSYIAQAGDWDISSITTTDEEVEEVKQVQECELQSISSAENLAITDLYVAPCVKPFNPQNDDVCYKEPSTSRPERSSPTRSPRKK